MKRAQVIRISGDRTWWEKERAPSAKAVVIPPRRRLANRYLKVAEIADKLSLDRSTIYDAIKANELEAQWVGTWRVSEEALETWMFLMNQKKRRG